MVKTYLKTLVRVFKKHIARFLSIVFMVLISVGFISGIGGAVNKIDLSLTRYYEESNVGDFIVKSKNSGGFTEDEIAKMKDLYGEENVSVGNSLDAEIEIDGKTVLARLYFYDGEQKVNVHKVVKGEGELGDSEAAAEQSDNKLAEIPLGTKIELDFKKILKFIAEENGEEVPPVLDMLPDGTTKKEVEITQERLSPLTFALDGEPSYLNPEGTEIPDTINAVNELIILDAVLYMDASVIPVVYGQPLLPARGDMYIALPDRSRFNSFSKAYDKYIDEQQTVVENELGKDNVQVLTLYDNFGFYSLSSYADKVMGITAVLLVAFLLITALVVQSNMARLMEEERAQIGCLRSLGYGAFRIIFKYALFAMLACGIAGVGAHFVGIGLSNLVYWVFNYSFVMPKAVSSLKVWFFIVTFTVIVAVTLLTTLLSGTSMMREKPANLLRPKAPKVGKKVFLERIPLIWNRLSFKYKSTMRNVLRYASRFIMTVVAVAGSMGLVLAGLALLDMCLFGDFGSPSIMLLAVIIVVFAGLLTAVVIYTLTNINVSERTREIATLMVLGYHDKEVTGYIYREVYINTAVGLIFGYPAGLLLMWFVFKMINFGSIAAVSWFVWLIAPMLTLLFTFLVTVLLRRKIVGIDMNNSLKAIE